MCFDKRVIGRPKKATKIGADTYTNVHPSLSIRKRSCILFITNFTLYHECFDGAFYEVLAGGAAPHGRGTADTNSEVPAREERHAHLLLPAHFTKRGLSKFEILLL